MTIDFKVTSDGTLALTDVEIDAMQKMLDAHDRGGFYMVYYAMTGSEEAALQASISTFSDNAGGVAYAANRLGQIWGGTSVYPGIYNQSQLIAQEALNFIKNDIAQDGEGWISNQKFFDSAMQAWTNSNALFYAPPNLFGTYDNSFDDAIPFTSFMWDINNSLLNVDLNAPDPFAGFITEMRAKYDAGTLSALLGMFVYDKFAKSQSNFESDEFNVDGYDLIVENGKVVGTFGLDFHDVKVSLGNFGFYTQLGGPIGSATNGIYNAFRDYLTNLIWPSGPIDPANLTESESASDGDTQPNAPLGPGASNHPIWTPTATAAGDVISLTESGTMDGGNGDDILFGSIAQDSLLGGNGNDAIWGRSGNDTLKGGAGDDVVRGGANNDTLSGGGGDDVLDGGDINLAAADDGTDKADYSAAANGIFIELGGGTQEDTQNGIIHVTDDGDGGSDILHSIEKIIGTNKGDTVKIVGAASSFPEIDLGTNPEDSPDRVDLSGISQGIKIDMGATGPTFGSGLTLKVKGAEVVIGTSGNDSINGGAADDKVSGGGGADKIIWGAGNDILYGEDGNDFIKGDDDGNDLLLGGSGADYIIAGKGDDIVDGGPGNDYIEITGTDGATIVFAEGSGHDVLGSMFTKREGSPYVGGPGHVPYKWYDDELHSDVLVKFEGLEAGDVELVWDFEENLYGEGESFWGGTSVPSQ